MRKKVRGRSVVAKSVDANVHVKYASRLWRGIAFWGGGPTNEPAFLFVQEANDFCRQRYQLCRIFLPRRLLAKVHPLLSIFHLVRPPHAFCVGGRPLQSTNCANVYFL